MIVVKIVCYCYIRDGSEPLRGAVVSLYDERGLFEQHRTDFTGRCVFSNLEPAAYTARETSVPYYALPSPTAHKLDGTDGRRLFEVGFASAPRFAFDENRIENAETRGRINELKEKARRIRNG